MTMVIAAGSRACGIWTRMLPIGACSLAAERGSRVRQQVSPTAPVGVLGRVDEGNRQAACRSIVPPSPTEPPHTSFCCSKAIAHSCFSSKTSCGEV